MRTPDPHQRLAIVGRTGSGKTVAAVWHLSNANFHQMPWVVYDFKRDSLLAELTSFKGVYEIGVEEVPSRPGIYLVHPLPNEDTLVEAQMWGLWAKQDVGVFIDEGYLVSNDAYRALLTQGRSLRIPIITLAQRPVWLDRFVFSEADFFQIFALNHIGDRRKVMEYVESADLSERLPEYHSYYYDVGRDETVVMKPVPTGGAILEVFDRRLEAMRGKGFRLFV